MKVKKMIVQLTLPNCIIVGNFKITGIIVEFKFPSPKPHYTFAKKGGGGKA